MELYRIKIKLNSPLVTTLKGDTIWGHIVWGIANHEGDSAVSDFLKLEDNNVPTLCVSSAFPEGCLCRPIPQPVKHTEKLTIEKYSQIKKNKKIIFSKASDYLDCNSSDENFTSKTVAVTHNTIDRESNSVLETGLYSVDEQWYGKNQLFDIYVATELSTDRLLQLFERAFENGYGADSSTGKGFICVEGKPEKVTCKKAGNKYMALAPFIKSNTDEIENLRADIFVRSGKVGGAFAAQGMSPYKKTVVLYNEGAVFESTKKISSVGCLIKNIHSDSRICQSGFAPVIPIE